MKDCSLSQIIKENLTKNVLILVCAFFFYPFLLSRLSAVSQAQINDLLLTLSLFLVTVCFANFAFTYEKMNKDRTWERFLSHLSTFIFMLLTALLLESVVISVQTVYPGLHSIILGFSILLYFGVVLYDFWDVLRVNNR